MRQDQQPPRPSFKDEANTATNIILFVCDAASLPILVVFNRDLGSRRVGLQALLTLLLIPLWATCWPDEDPTPMVCILFAFILMCVVTRCGVWTRSLREGGDTEHRNSDGQSRIGRLIPWFGGAAGQHLQTAVILAGGLLVLSFDPAVGSFVTLAAVTRLVVLTAQRIAFNDRIAAMRDQQIEQRAIMEAFRRSSGR
ncbi:MAG TPA: hypothetical protein VGN12_19610 [Pirellulales bacterium]|jgi:hypothetical protein